MRCSATLRPRPAIRSSWSGMSRPRPTGGCGSCGSPPNSATAGASAGAPTSQTSAANPGSSSSVRSASGATRWLSWGPSAQGTGKKRVAAGTHDRFGQCPAAARREHAVHFRRERREVGDVRQDRLSPHEVKRRVCERERVATRIDDLDRAVQSRGGVELRREAAKARGGFDRGHLRAEARRQDAGRPADPGAEVEYPLARSHVGELRERHRSGEAERVELVHGDEVVDAQVLGVQSRVAEASWTRPVSSGPS